jgi:hypothetical protein
MGLKNEARRTKIENDAEKQIIQGGGRIRGTGNLDQWLRQNLRAKSPKCHVLMLGLTSQKREERGESFHKT